MKRLIIPLTAVFAGVGIAACAGQAVTPAATVAITQHATAARLSAPLLGVDVYSESPYSPSSAAGYGSAVLPYVSKDLRAQVVSLMWDLCSPGRRSNVVDPCKPDATTGTGSMPASSIGALATMAKKDGLQVQMRPIIRVGPPSGWNNPHLNWEGHIKPQSVESWLKSLLSAELPYLRVARSVGVEQFVVGTELASLPRTSRWSWFLRRATSACRCQLSYAAQTAGYLANSPNLPRVNALGTDMYPAINLPASASQAKVTARWENYLAPVPESRLDRTSLDEISIRATAGAYQHPSSWDIGGRADPAVQARYFTAACATAARYHMRALFFYFVPLNDDPAHPFSFPAFFVSNAGSRAVAGCRKILATGAVK